MQITGACHCGRISYEAVVEPLAVSICHCTDCQVLTGSPFRASIQAIPGTFRVTSGTPRIYTKIAESGAQREQAFCENCGTPIYATSPGPEPRTYNVRVGGVQQRALLKPGVQIWCQSELPWLEQVSGLPRVYGNPGQRPR